MSWPIYRMVAELPKAERSRLGMPRMKVDDAYWDGVFRIADEHNRILFAAGSPSGVGIVTNTVMDSEYRWWRKKRPTYFLESKDLARWIYGVGLDVRFEEVAVPGGILSVSAPEGLEIEGIPIRPFLFSKLWHDFTWDRETHRLSPLARLEPVGNNRPHWRMSLVLQPERGVHTVNTMASDLQMQALLERGDPYGSDPDWNWDTTGLHEDLDDDEKRTVAVHFRLALAVVTYLKAFPDCLKSGFPRSASKADRNALARFGLKRAFHVTPHPRIRLSSETVRSHWRRDFWRTLRHPRYYRNPDGTTRDPQGNYRVVYVRETVVNRGRLDPHTVVEAPENHDFGTESVENP